MARLLYARVIRRRPLSQGQQVGPNKGKMVKYAREPTNSTKSCKVGVSSLGAVAARDAHIWSIGHKCKSKLHELIDTGQGFRSAGALQEQPRGSHGSEEDGAEQS